MKHLLFLAPLGALLLASNPAGAQSAFDGTWKIDMNKVAFSQKPDVFFLENGMYTCKSCTPAYTIKADGSDQPFTGHPYFDTVAVKVVNDHEIQETDKKAGKVVITSTSTVSPDGKTLNFVFTDSSDTNGGAPVQGKGEASLVAKGPAGSLAISGSWKTTRMESLSDNGITWTYKTSGDEITMTNPTGQTYTAKLNGPDAPMKGDPGVSSVSVKTMGNTLTETDKRKDKVVGILKLTVEPGGKTAKASFTDALQNRTTTAVAVKQ